MKYQDIKAQEREQTKKIAELMQLVNELRADKKATRQELEYARMSKLKQLAKEFCDYMQYDFNVGNYKYNRFGKLAFKLPDEPYNNRHADLRNNFLKAWHDMNCYIAKCAQAERESFIKWIAEGATLKD